MWLQPAPPKQFRERLGQEGHDTGEGYEIAPVSDILGIAEAEAVEWVYPRLRPQPIGTFRQPVDVPTFASRISLQALPGFCDALSKRRPSFTDAPEARVP